MRHGAGAESRARTASDNGYFKIVADPDDGTHLLDSPGHHRHQGHFPVEHETVALKGAQRTRVRDNTVCRQNGVQRRQ